jgi:hypothetical protein
MQLYKTMTTLEELKEHNEHVRQNFEYPLEMSCLKEDVANISPSLPEYGRKQGHVWIIRTGPSVLLDTESIVKAS